ncbi:MAG: hypothetical protein CMA63_03010 [Euryarchaeota archaeon]|nr:hypothetical protein [Euryarchaeota archaeon]|tara:strand:+ start:8962 stop:9345 length:384 start_codon:yes stop_codon:yes gene_type:complete
MDDGWNKATMGICVSATLYAVLFISHIIAAALNFDWAFNAVAVMLSILTFSVGPSSVLLGNISVPKEQLQANTIGFGIGCLLACGLAWAYAERSFDFGLTLSFVLFTAVIHLAHRSRVKRIMDKKMD